MNSKNRAVLSQIAIIAIVGAIAYGLGYQSGSARLAKSPDDESATQSPQSESASNALPEADRPPSPTPATDAPPQAIELRGRSQASNQMTEAYEAAAADTQAALAKIDTLSGRAQIEFAAGVFRFIAAHSDPADALTIANSQSGAVKGIALRTLVAEWTQDPALNAQASAARQRRIQNIGNGRYGLEAELASIIAQSKAPPSVARAWMDAFSDQPARSEIVARLAPSLPGFDPASTLSETASWTDWEKSRLEKSLISNWAQRDPQAAWEWYSNSNDSDQSNYSSDILNAWARSNTNELINSLSAIESPDDRMDAIEAISTSLAQRGTDQALDWVESLTDPAEQDAGFQAVYENTPKGIGAVLQTENGFPKIAEIIPGGALDSTDLQPGDLIIESTDTGGEPRDLYGISLGETVGILRGAPGSEVEVRVLRKNEATGQLEERTATVVRDLLILESQGRG